MADLSTSKKMAALAVEALEDRKGEDIRIIDISEISTIADYFIIASGTNVNQVQALADNAQEKLGRAGFMTKNVEGYEAANWILLDFGDIIVHVFSNEMRVFYDLERIWRDGKEVDSAALSEGGIYDKKISGHAVVFSTHSKQQHFSCSHSR